MGQDMAGGDVQKIAFRPVCTHHLGMGKSILRFSSVFNATHGVGNILEQISLCEKRLFCEDGF